MSTKEAIAVRKRIGKKARSLRQARGWSQETLALETGFGRSFMSNIENGQKDIRLSTLVKLATVLNVDVRKLFGDQDHSSRI
ncbi:MAG TPA: helix-turn-helix transcriptional regulator [Candidatus Angelobacter sp.]|nr:helix-turn-helix transcriptional regulator [Candidatus Angelobacter sp.]